MAIHFNPEFGDRLEIRATSGGLLVQARSPVFQSSRNVIGNHDHSKRGQLFCGGQVAHGAPKVPLLSRLR